MASKRVLGIDLGPNSIGWALIDDNRENPDESRLVDVGVRVFPEGVDKFDTSKEASRNEKRRIARGMRRQIRRRARRRRVLRESLIAAGLWPKDDAEAEAALYQLDPYTLRARALDEKLSPNEIGRVFLHLNQRRGFKSNKKEEAKADAKAKRKKSVKEETTKPDAQIKTVDILLEMSELDKAISLSESRTLGEYLYHKSIAMDHTKPNKDDNIRGRHTQRKMLKDEFDYIWAVQSKYYPDLLTDELRYGKLGRQKDIRKPMPRRRKYLNKEKTVINPRIGISDFEAFGLFGLIFFHRTLKPVPKKLIGICELEQEKKERRCAKADRRAQQFRLWQTINNLNYIDPSTKETCNLDECQRKMLFEYLATREKASFSDIRKRLGFLESVKFKLEQGNSDNIHGMITDSLMAKVLGKQWHKYPEEIKNGMVNYLIESVEDSATHELLMREFGLTAEQADAVLGVDLPDGYFNLSLVAINKLLPYMANGYLYEHRDPKRSARAAAGYPEPWSIQRRTFDKLPNPKRSSVRDCPICDINNPVVKRALTEVRRVVNAIIKEYGRPDEIHIEMGRDVKTRPKKDPNNPAYRKYQKQMAEMKKRQKERDQAKEVLRQHGISFGKDGENIQKYLLWLEQETTCVYSGKTIAFDQLFSSEIVIDHILPRSQSLDDSRMNKVICFWQENSAKEKGQKTPRGWLEPLDPAKYDDVCQRAKKLPYPKYERFLCREVKVDDFIARQLNDTRYISKITVEYMKCLFGYDENKRGAVLGLKGQITSTLRHHWGLETILANLPDSPAWQEQAKLRPGEKNRADHRHHAIDAIVIALANDSQLQKLSKGFAVREMVDSKTGDLDYKTFYHGELINKPWPSFRNDVLQRMKEVKVSHRVERKVRGALHKDKPYGPTPNADKWVRRKPLVELSAKEVLNIRDTSKKNNKSGIKQIVINALQKSGIEIASTKSKADFIDVKSNKVVPKNQVKAVLCNITMPSGVPIKKARIFIKDETIRCIRKGQPGEAYVKPGSTHHICIFEWDKNGEKCHGAVFVTMLEAANRIKRKEPLIQRDAKKLSDENREMIPANAQFVMSISNGELVLARINGEERLLKLRTSKSTEKKLIFQFSEDARKTYKPIRTTCNTLFTKYHAKKVTVDPLGRIRWAND